MKLLKPSSRVAYPITEFFRPKPRFPVKHEASKTQSQTFDAAGKISTETPTLSKVTSLTSPIEQSQKTKLDYTSNLCTPVDEAITETVSKTVTSSPQQLSLQKIADFVIKNIPQDIETSWRLASIHHFFQVFYTALPFLDLPPNPLLLEQFLLTDVFDSQPQDVDSSSSDILQKKAQLFGNNVMKTLLDWNLQKRSRVVSWERCLLQDWMENQADWIDALRTCGVIVVTENNRTLPGQNFIQKIDEHKVLYWNDAVQENTNHSFFSLSFYLRVSILYILCHMSLDRNEKINLFIKNMEKEKKDITDYLRLSPFGSDFTRRQYCHVNSVTKGISCRIYSFLPHSKEIKVETSTLQEVEYLVQRLEYTSSHKNVRLAYYIKTNIIPNLQFEIITRNKKEEVEEKKIQKTLLALSYMGPRNTRSARARACINYSHEGFERRGAPMFITQTRTRSRLVHKSDLSSTEESSDQHEYDSDSDHEENYSPSLQNLKAGTKRSSKSQKSSHIMLKRKRIIEDVESNSASDNVLEEAKKIVEKADFADGKRRGLSLKETENLRISIDRIKTKEIQNQMLEYRNQNSDADVVLDVQTEIENPINEKVKQDHSLVSRKHEALYYDVEQITPDKTRDENDTPREAGGLFEQITVKANKISKKKKTRASRPVSDPKSSSIKLTTSSAVYPKFIPISKKSKNHSQKTLLTDYFPLSDTKRIMQNNHPPDSNQSLCENRDVSPCDIQSNKEPKTLESPIYSVYSNAEGHITNGRAHLSQMEMATKGKDESNENCEHNENGDDEWSSESNASSDDSPDTFEYESSESMSSDELWGPRRRSKSKPKKKKRFGEPCGIMFKAADTGAVKTFFSRFDNKKRTSEKPG